MTTKSMSNKYHIKKLDNEGLNYLTWAVCCQLVLEDLNIWSIVNPNVSTSTPPAPPSTEPSDPSKAEWHKKNSKVWSVIFLSIEDTPIQIIKTQHLAKDIWKTLTERYVTLVQVLSMHQY